MPKYIVKCRGHYAEWSTVVDALVTRFMPLDEFKAYYRDQYGERGMDDLPARLARADGPNGCSAYSGESWESMVGFNRCGPNETRLTEDEMWAEYGPTPRDDAVARATERVVKAWTRMDTPGAECDLHDAVEALYEAWTDAAERAASDEKGG